MITYKKCLDIVNKHIDKAFAEAHNELKINKENLDLDQSIRLKYLSGELAKFLYERINETINI